MFEQVFENLRKASESAIQMQQEVVKKWTAIWPVVPPASVGITDPVTYQKKWVEILEELVKKQRTSLETLFSTGLENFEAGFRLVQAANPEEFRTKVIDYWQKTIDCLRKTSEAQMHTFQAVVAKSTELLSKGASA